MLLTKRRSCMILLRNSTSDSSILSFSQMRTKVCTMRRLVAVVSMDCLIETVNNDGVIIVATFEELDEYLNYSAAMCC